MVKLKIALAAFPLLLSLQAAGERQFPVDPDIRTGKLGNGLTYYIRHNGLPAGQAEFYIAQKVGSMQEEDNQRGLAHFLEHMAFNGTVHFPGKQLTEYLESTGAKFGYNINASTGFDQTVYTLMNIPVARRGVVDSALLVLYDWSCGISLEDKEIDAERGVIREEWRTGQNAQMRIWEKILPVVFKGSRYGNRLPIGTLDVIDNFTYDELRDYYRRWYRPDLQGIIVVGDVDVDYTEAKIRELFGAIPLSEKRAKRVYYPVPDNREPIVAMAADREITAVHTSIFYKHDPLPAKKRNTAAYLNKVYMRFVISTMINSRLEEIAMQPDPPFMAAGVHDDRMLGTAITKEAFTATVMSDEKGAMRALRAMAQEIRRVDLHGFTVAEYQRAKLDFMQQVETAYNEREKRRNGDYADEYTNSFLYGEPIPGIETEYDIYRRMSEEITVKDIDRYIRKLITGKNIVIIMQGPEREGMVYPSKEELLAVYGEAVRSAPEPYVENLSGEPLIGSVPAAGTIVGVARDTVFEAVVWSLSNGAKAVVKPTPYRDDQILVRAVSPGGTSLIGSEFDAEVEFMNEAAGLGGLGSFSATDLPKALAGKNAGVSGSVGELSETVSATSTPRDLETMMQLIYLQFTDVRRDDEAMASWRSRQSASLRNMAANPDFVYSDSLSRTIYDHQPRMDNPTAEEAEKFDYGKALELFRARFADASDFTFIFVGNIDTAALRPYVEQYIASLPSTGSLERAGKPAAMAKGRVINYFEREVESPKVTMTYVFSDMMDPDLKNTVEMDALWQVLFARYFATLREDEGGTYSPQIRGTLSSSSGRAAVTVAVETNARLYERLGEMVVGEIEKLADTGLTDDEFQKVKEYMLKKDVENRQENSFWMSRLSDYYLNGRNYLSGYASTVNAMTKEDIRRFAEKLLSAGNMVNVTMNGIGHELQQSSK